MSARVHNDSTFSEPFPVMKGAKQGCVLSSSLFSMMFTAMLPDAKEDCDDGFSIKYRFDGKLQSTLVISNSKGLPEIIRNIHSSTYQICRIKEK